MSATLVGYIAAVLGVSAFVPQAWRVVKTRDTRSLSTPMWVVECLAFAAWVVYGVLLGELPIILPNSICFVLSAFILTMKLALPRASSSARPRSSSSSRGARRGGRARR